MKIQEITNFTQNKNYNVMPKRQLRDNKFVNNMQYNPAYYKPRNISFKGKVFDSYFPSDIFKMDEEKFDKLILNIIQDKNTHKRDALANYIVNAVAKKTNAMDFVNMWKRQVPTLVTPGMISIGGSSSSAAISKALNIAARNTSNSMVDKFYASDFQSEILAKDGKNAMGGLLAYKLFTMAAADPEPYSKIGLYAAGLAVSAGTYALSKKESKKIQDQQFLNATKECMRLGALDPKELLTKINKKLVKDVDNEVYDNWKEENLAKTRYIQTGSRIDKHNDFDSEEAKKVLKNVLLVLSTNLGLNDEKIVAFLDLVKSVHKSAHETGSALYLVNKMAELQRNMFDNDEERYLNYKPLYDTYIEMADLEKMHEEYSNAIDSLSQAEQIANRTYGEDSQQVFDTNLKILDYIQERKKYNDTILPFVMAEEKESISEVRQDHHTDLKKSILADVDKDEDGYYLKDDYLNDTAKVKVLDKILTLMQKHPNYTENFDKLLDIMEKYPDAKLYSMLKINCKDKSFLEPAIKNNMPILKKNCLQDNLQNIRISFLINALQGNLDQDDCDLEKFIVSTYGECSDERAEYYKSLAKWMKAFDKQIYYYRYTIPEYSCRLNDRYTILKYKYGISNEKTINAALDYLFSPIDNISAGYIISEYEENASPEIKQKYSGKIYEAYANRMHTSLKYSNEINENQVTEGMLAYQKAIKETRTPNPLLIYRYLDFIDMVKSREINSTFEMGLGYCYSSSSGEGPLIEKTNSLPKEEAERLFYESQIYESIGIRDEEFKNLVKSCPGPFRINERKLLQLFKKYNTAFFQKKYEMKIASQISQIESTIGNYERK